MEEMLRADNITFSYTDDQHRAVDGLSLRVKRGEYVAVLGANGCGKSTLAKHFNAILLPQAGTVYVEDMSTADETSCSTSARRWAWCSRTRITRSSPP